MAVHPFAGGAPLTPAPPATYRTRRCRDAWFDTLFPLYAAKWHPAIAAIEAHLGAERRCR
jgi:hypothetical protein